MASPVCLRSGGSAEALALDLELPQMMVQVLVHQRRPFHWSQRPEQTVWMLRASLRRFLSVIELRGIRRSFTIIDFANRPSNSPISLRGGSFSPTAHSMAAEQCASACAALILPHSRSLAGLSCQSRSFTSSTAAVSKRFFIRGHSKLIYSHMVMYFNRAVLSLLTDC